MFNDILYPTLFCVSLQNQTLDGRIMYMYLTGTLVQNYDITKQHGQQLSIMGKIVVP